MTAATAQEEESKHQTSYAPACLVRVWGELVSKNLTCQNTKRAKRKKVFPKKAKLISDGGFYKIVPIKDFAAVIHVTVMRKITISTSLIFHDESMKFNLKFYLDRIKGGYAEYRQIDCIKLSEKD